MIDPEDVRVIRAADTMHLGRFYASQALVKEARERDDLRVIDEYSEDVQLKQSRGRVHSRVQVFLALCLRLVVAITNNEREDNPGSTIRVCEECYDTLLNL